MAAPDPYPTPSMTGSADQEMATPDGETENDMGQSSDSESAEPEGDEEANEPLKNHLYLPEDFPGDKKPEQGDTKEFMVKAEYVETANGEQCWKELTVDGVPISDDASDEEDESGDQDEDESQTDDAQAGDETNAQGDDESQSPETAGSGTGNAFTALIMRGKEK